VTVSTIVGTTQMKVVISHAYQTSILLVVSKVSSLLTNRLTSLWDALEIGSSE